MSIALRPVDWMLLTLCLGLLACIALLAWRRRTQQLAELFDQPPFTPDAIALARQERRAQPGECPCVRCQRNRAEERALREFYGDEVTS